MDEPFRGNSWAMFIVLKTIFIPGFNTAEGWLFGARQVLNSEAFGLRDTKALF